MNVRPGDIAIIINSANGPDGASVGSTVVEPPLASVTRSKEVML